MKNLLIITLIIVSLSARAQSAITNPPAPTYIIDSVEMNTPHLKQVIKYLNGDEIGNINVGKNAQHPNGLIYITLKNHTLLTQILKDKFLSLNEITLKNMPEPGIKKRPIYFIDNQLITDTTGIAIPAMFVRNVEIIKAADAPYFKQTFPNAVIVKVSTKQPIRYVKGIGD